MTDTVEAREIADETVEEMVTVVNDSLEIQQVTLVERGFCSIYRVAAVGPERSRDLYLKASPDGRTWGIPVEARIQAVLSSETTIPVPDILGAVNDHETLPSPFYVMTALPGGALPYEEVAELDDDILGQIARETGHYLAELHSLSPVEQFGQIAYEGQPLTGDTPPGDPAQLTVEPAEETWVAFLEEYTSNELDRHTESQFAELTDDLTEWVEDAIKSLEGPFDPVLGRNDHGLHNLLIDATTGDITGMVDWNYTLAVPPAFDVEFAIYLYSGAFFAGRSAVSDRRPLVRDALLSAYQSEAPSLADRVSTREPLYEALAMIRIMNDFDSLDCPAGTEQESRDGIVADVRSLIDSDRSP